MRRPGGIIAGPYGGILDPSDAMGGPDSDVANGFYLGDLLGGPAGQLAGAAVNPNLYNFDNMNEGTVVPGNAAFSNWTWWNAAANAQTAAAGNMAVAPSFGANGTYNVGETGGANRALGFYWTNNGATGLNPFAECDVTVGASGLFSMTFDHFIGFLRLAPSNPRWCGMRVEITGSGVVFASTIVATTQTALVYYTAATAIGKVSVAANWAGLAPGVHRLRFSAGPNTLFATPGGQVGGNLKNITSTIDNLLIIP
jgi:hypothetical protein